MAGEWRVGSSGCAHWFMPGSEYPLCPVYTARSLTDPATPRHRLCKSCDRQRQVLRQEQSPEEAQQPQPVGHVYAVRQDGAWVSEDPETMEPCRVGVLTDDEVHPRWSAEALCRQVPGSKVVRLALVVAPEQGDDQ